MDYYHVDVFSSVPMSGNGLTVVFPQEPLDGETLLKIAQELKQFETAFVFPQSQTGAYPVQIFTTQEELPFAGHPVLGTAAVIHRVSRPSETEAQIRIDLSGRILTVASLDSGNKYTVTMNQGKPVFSGAVSVEHYPAVAEALGLSTDDLDARFPIEVVSTGLPYLLVPVRDIGNARIQRRDFEDFLGSMGAKFVYLFDPETLECRTWDNTGATEDVATGSAAGPLCAYLVRQGMKKEGEVISLRQGKYLGRPSVIEGWTRDGEVRIRGDVAFFASGGINI